MIRFRFLIESIATYCNQLVQHLHQHLDFVDRLYIEEYLRHHQIREQIVNLLDFYQLRFRELHLIIEIEYRFLIEGKINFLPKFL